MHNELIKKLNAKVKEVEVTVNPIDSNNVIGHKKENVIKLKDIYDVDLILKQDKNIKQGKSKKLYVLYGKRLKLRGKNEN